MRSTAALWIIAMAAHVSLDAAHAGFQRPRPILVTSVKTANTSWPEVMYFPNSEGLPQPGIIFGQGHYLPVSRDDVSFRLYTRRGPKKGVKIKLGDVTGLKNTTFDNSHPTHFITHGLFSSIESDAVQGMKDLYVEYQDVNVIAVDWSRIASNPLYFIVKRQTVPVGGIVAEFVNFLHKWAPVDLESIHLIGHSLGAHVMGIAGKAFTSRTNKIGRITGLDPAGPLFFLKERHLRLDRDDAKFVDVIHTNAGWLGFKDPIGTVDFFPNGGELQPGCKHYNFGVCDHSRVWYLYDESIYSSRFSSLPCKSYQDFKRGKCNHEQRAPMGELVPKSTRGTYFLSTSSSPPYALGP